MKRKQKKQIRNVLIGILIVVTLFFLVQSNFKLPLAVGFGSQALSISHITYDSQNDLVTIYGVAGIGADQLDIDWSPSYISSHLDTPEVKATKSVSGTITMDKETKSFQAVQNYNKVFYSYFTKKIGYFGSCPYVSGATNVRYVPVAFSLNYVCIYKQSFGNEGQFNGNALESFTLNANIEGASGKLIADPRDGQRVLHLSDGVSKLTWTGSLNNWNQIYTPPYNVLFSNSQFKNLIDSNAYSDWLSSEQRLNSCFDNLKGNIYFTTGDVENCVTNLNNKLYQVTSEKLFSYLGSIQATGGFTSLGSPTTYLNIILGTPSELPTFILTLPASKVGITQLIGEPSIQSNGCPPPLSLTSGQQKTENVRVKNIGDHSGEFTASANCQGSLIQAVSSSQLVEKGDMVNMPIQFSGINPSQGTQSSSCTVSVRDTNSGKVSTCQTTVSVTYTPSYRCTPNEISCKDINTLATCNSLGTDYLNTTNCENGCQVFSGGGAECKASPKGCGFLGIDCFFSNIGKAFTDFFNGVGNIFDIVKYLLVFIGGLFSWLFGYDFFSKFKGLRNKEWLAVILSGIMGFGIAWLIYSAFWWGVVAFAIWIILRIAESFIPGFNVLNKLRTKR